VEAVLQQMCERTDHEALGCNSFAVSQLPRLWPNAFLVQRSGQSADRADAEIIGKDLADEVGLVRDDLQLLGDAAVAERHRSADPDPLALGGGNLVPNTFADDLALELRKGQ